jgi:hypothetical protein
LKHDFKYELTLFISNYVLNFLQFQIAFLNSEIEKDGCERAEDQIDKLLPELTHFCGYIRDYVANHMGKVPPREDDDDDEVDEVSLKKKKKPRNKQSYQLAFSTSSRIFK